jgi:calcineurin-like phosphoesterase family protein
MNYWVIADSHFDHAKMLSACNRPVNYESIILKNLYNNILPNDILIHLGDVCWKNDEFWHEKLNKINCKKKWLVIGNHDGKSNGWYIDHGWDMICRHFELKVFGLHIVFSHKPLKDYGYDLCIHGHFHNTTHHDQDYAEPEMKDIRNDKQYLISIENTNYMPKNLERIVEEFNDKKKYEKWLENNEFRQ